MSPVLTLLLFLSVVPLSCSSPVRPGSAFSSSLQDAQSLIRKMLKSFPELQKSCVKTHFTDDPFSLEYIRETLAIPAAPKLAPISETHTLEMNLRGISEGLQLHQHLLQEVMEKVECSGKLQFLQVEIGELNLHIRKVSVGVPVSDPQLSSTSSLSTLSKDDYSLNIAVHFLLEQLRAFSQDIARTLREIQHTHIHI